MLDDVGEGQPRVYLSHLDADGGLAFSYDNPDFADNHAVLLKPLVHDDEELGYARPTMQQLRQLALLAAPGDRTAVTYWGAYDQPRSILQSMFPQFAQDGAAGVREFHEGLRATHERASAHTTTIGHSYGGVLAGHAGRGGALDTDSVLLLGSWGTGVNRAAELRLTGVAPERTGEHVFATMASSDFTRLMPDTHGVLPTDRAFGATVFDSVSSIPDQWNIYDHTAEAYLHSANSASANVGRVITGRGDLVS
ncbi:alpha/beta hydrolase [Nocardia sp. NPDC001965]